MKEELYHLNLEINKSESNNRIVSIDTEWAKNWKATEKFVPFCISIHSIYTDGINDILDIDQYHMQSELYFRLVNETSQDFLLKVDAILSKYLQVGTTIVGHQISSDLHTFQQCSKTKLNTINHLIELFRIRKKENLFDSINIADTRYDIKNRVVGNGEEKLRNVSLRFNIFAVQNELNKYSLTKMYNLYLNDNDKEKREKLLVMNWRHAFQTSLIWLLNINHNKKLLNTKYQGSFLLTNDIMYRMGNGKIDYLNSKEYLYSMSFNGIKEYINKYSSKIDIDKLLIK